MPSCTPFNRDDTKASQRREALQKKTMIMAREPRFPSSDWQFGTSEGTLSLIRTSETERYFNASSLDLEKQRSRLRELVSERSWPHHFDSLYYPPAIVELFQLITYMLTAS